MPHLLRSMAKGKGKVAKPPKGAQRHVDNISDNSDGEILDGYEPEPLFYNDEEKILASLVRCACE